MLEPAASILTDNFLDVEFDVLSGWTDDDHAAAYETLRLSAASILKTPPASRPMGPDPEAIQVTSQFILQAGRLDGSAAREFFERHFRPRRITEQGFVTGYYEPEVPASPIRTDRFTVPLLKRPPDLVKITDANRPGQWDPELHFGRRVGSQISVHPDRAAIADGALEGRNLELAWLEDPVTAYFIHIQGSARLRMTDGRLIRVGFDGKSGHSYTSIGKLAVARGHLPPNQVDKTDLENLLRSRPDLGESLMRENQSYIFFREYPDPGLNWGPVGAAGMPLTAGRSLAVDRKLHTFHGLMFVVADDLPDPTTGNIGRFARLMVAQDTGSAIVGPARGDIFYGSGDRAGTWAGRVRHKAVFYQLVPLIEEQG